MHDHHDYGKGLTAGFFIGGLVGAGLAFFLSPKSGPENRRFVVTKAQDFKDRFQTQVEDITEIVAEIFGEVTASGISLYEDARELLANQIAAFQENLEDIDRQKYLDSVDHVIATLGKNKKNAPQDLVQLKKYWTKNWRKIANKLELS